MNGKDLPVQELVEQFLLRATEIGRHERPDGREWRVLMRRFCVQAPAGVSRPVRNGLLTVAQSRVYMLLVLGYGNDDIYTLLEMSPQRLTNLKAAINEKLFGERSAATLRERLYLEMKNEE